MKSLVTMEQHQCPVCGIAHDTGTVLLDRQLRDKFEDRTVTGISLCPEHKAMVDAGFTILIEMNSAMQRTGRIVQVKHEVWPNIFDAAIPAGGVAYVDGDTIDKLAAMVVMDAPAGPTDAIH